MQPHAATVAGAPSLDVAKLLAADASSTATLAVLAAFLRRANAARTARSAPTPRSLLAAFKVIRARRATRFPVAAMACAW